MERDLEKAIAADIKILGGLFLKWKGTVRGVPDRILMAPMGITVFVETKYSGGLSAQQKKMHGELRALGNKVFTVKTDRDRFLLYVWLIEESFSRLNTCPDGDYREHFLRIKRFQNCPFLRKMDNFKAFK